MKRYWTIVFMFCLPHLALAAEAEKDAKPEKKKVILFKKSEQYQFTGTKLEGKLKKPDLSYIYQRKGLRSEKIVSIPEDFNDEIADGANQF